MKIIKRLALTLALISLSSFLLHAQENWETMNVDVKNISNLEIYSNFEVTFEKSNDCRIVLEIPSEYINYLDLITSEEKVVLGFHSKKFTRAAKMAFENTTPRAKIYAPSFKEIELSGVVKMKLVGDFSMNEADIDLNGASKLEGGSIRARDIEVEVSGCAHFADVKIYADNIKLDVSGATFVKLPLQVKDIEVETSGAADVVFESIGGFAGRVMDVEMSGASKLKALDFPVENVKADLSGAAQAKISPLKTLNIETSGAASLRYKKAKNLSIRGIDVSSASSIKAI